MNSFMFIIPLEFDLLFPICKLLAWSNLLTWWLFFLKDELLGLVEAPQGDPIFKNSSLDMDVLYRAGETQQVDLNAMLFSLFLWVLQLHAWCNQATSFF